MFAGNESPMVAHAKGTTDFGGLVYTGCFNKDGDGIEKRR